MTYRTHDIAVDGGILRVGQWGSLDPERRGATVIAVHGITASHMAWAAVAKAMPQACLIAPDLRGRGRSAELPGPYGMARHAADLEAVIGHLNLPPAILVGHSMGAFVAMVAAHLYPDRFSDVLLIDGGLPLSVPAGVDKEILFEKILGPAARRLSMTFPDRASYLKFWKQHPAFADPNDVKDDVLAEFASYDLTGTEPLLTPSTSLEAVRADSMDQYGGGVAQEALDELRMPSPGRRRKAVSLLTAPRGLLNQTPGLYTPAQIERWSAELPGLKIREVPDVNHYTIVMGAKGADVVAGEVLAFVHAREPVVQAD
jgi:lipase